MRPACAQHGHGRRYTLAVTPNISVVILRSKATKDLMNVAEYMPRNEILR